MNRLYYLISTIPHFDPVDSKSHIDVSAILNDIINNTFDKNLEYIKMLLVANDLRNLPLYFSLNSESRTLSDDSTFPSLLLYESLDELDKEAEIFPKFLSSILQDETHTFRQSTELEIKNYLWKAYWKDISQMDQSYLTEIVKDFVLIQNFAAWLRAKETGESVEANWVGFEELFEELSTGRQTINSLSQDYPFLIKMQEMTLALPEEAEKWMDELLIKKAEAKLSFDLFDIDHLLFLTLKLMTLAKWQNRGYEKGKMRFEFLTAQMTGPNDQPHY